MYLLARCLRGDAHEKSDVITSVSEHGTGIQEKYIPHLVEQFYRIKNKNYDPTWGFGIAHYLVAELLKRRME